MPVDAIGNEWWPPPDGAEPEAAKAGGCGTETDAGSGGSGRRRRNDGAGGARSAVTGTAGHAGAEPAEAGAGEAPAARVGSDLITDRNLPFLSIRSAPEISFFMNKCAISFMDHGNGVMNLILFEI